MVPLDCDNIPPAFTSMQGVNTPVILTVAPVTEKVAPDETFNVPATEMVPDAAVAVPVPLNTTLLKAKAGILCAELPLKFIVEELVVYTPAPGVKVPAMNRVEAGKVLLPPVPSISL